MKRLALVTGGVGGIGTAICKRLAKDGHFVVANYAIPGTDSATGLAHAGSDTVYYTVASSNVIYRRVLSTSFGFGGLNASVVLGAPDGS